MNSAFDPIDVNHWDRADAFRFFRGFDDPFFNICAQVEIGGLLREARRHGHPPSLLILWHAIRAANEIEAFRLRLHGEDVRRYHRIKPACTMRRGDNGYFFGYFDYEHGMTATEFISRGRAAIETQQHTPGLGARPDVEDVIHCSMLPWINFTGLRHARHTGYPDSIPKLVFGKYTEMNGKWMLPLAVDLHHALADGWHAAQWFEKMEWK